ncbi:hypothetical protein CYMTET_21009 [Cymbomonas tetramitiformis]|uniref:Uncharacterized protein n=1 Tax=Cymbomonas tetramitiformis TaxID=36881 RepID=A0AAE0G2U9_9CHLO|nr:hypothetical protein CYMTET_21009 [Cymbomonas tetramitiformis]
MQCVSVGPVGPVKPLPRWGHTANLICNPNSGERGLYVFGGHGGDQSSHLNDVRKFDLDTSEWSKVAVKGTPPCPRDSHTATTVGLRLFIFAGTDGNTPLDDLYIFDTAREL